MFAPRACAFLAIFVTASSVFADPTASPSPVPDAPPVDVEALKKELKAIHDRQSEDRIQRYAGILQKFLSASQGDDTSTRIYSDSVHVSEYSEGPRDSARFQQWRDKNKDFLSKDRAVGMAARLHLRYVAISLQRAAYHDQPPPFRELWDYVLSLADAKTEFGAALTETEISKDLLEKPVSEGAIAKAAGIAEDIKSLKNWEFNAGALKEIIDKDIRVPLRELKDPRVLDTWKMEIELRTKIVQKTRSDVEKDTFMKVDLPRMYWGQAKDYIVVGQRNRGISEMVKLLHAYPAHPDFNVWVTEITDQINQDPGPESGATANQHGAANTNQPIPQGQ